MDSAAILFILAIAGEVIFALYVLEDVLNRLPRLFASAQRARDTWDQLTRKTSDTSKPHGLSGLQARRAAAVEFWL
ncbi:hypothetical protein [Streptomyces sp. NPDC008092]|uniref:hypothetical protein n=1 Tax=Streptomyces sp. NPDC008092 TaxID=3364808 RepID=UPI0036E6540F